MDFEKELARECHNFNLDTQVLWRPGSDVSLSDLNMSFSEYLAETYDEFIKRRNFGDMANHYARITDWEQVEHFLYNQDERSSTATLEDGLRCRGVLFFNALKSRCIRCQRIKETLDAHERRKDNEKFRENIKTKVTSILCCGYGWWFGSAKDE